MKYKTQVVSGEQIELFLGDARRISISASDERDSYASHTPWCSSSGGLDCDCGVVPKSSAPPKAKTKKWSKAKQAKIELLAAKIIAGDVVVACPSDDGGCKEHDCCGHAAAISGRMPPDTIEQWAWWLAAHVITPMVQRRDEENHHTRTEGSSFFA